MLVEICAESGDVLIDLAYGTDRNFCGAAIYRRSACYLHQDAAERLSTAVTLARALRYQLKIFDAFRPSEAQWMLWNHKPDPDYLADPRRGSPHSMGIAVDLTLVASETGTELDMGTGFDDFTPSSWHGSLLVPADAQMNRLILLGIMTAAGFDFYKREWWHYQLFQPRGRYPVLSDSVLREGML
jgi:D-alanyl-D-alanine dipeptidase